VRIDCTSIQIVQRYIRLNADDGNKLTASITTNEELGQVKAILLKVQADVEVNSACRQLRHILC
jgi:hypothetical protein